MLYSCDQMYRHISRLCTVLLSVFLYIENVNQYYIIPDVWRTCISNVTWKLYSKAKVIRTGETVQKLAKKHIVPITNAYTTWRDPPGWISIFHINHVSWLAGFLWFLSHFDEALLSKFTADVWNHRKFALYVAIVVYAHHLHFHIICWQIICCHMICRGWKQGVCIVHCFYCVHVNLLLFCPVAIDFVAFYVVNYYLSCCYCCVIVFCGRVPVYWLFVKVLLKFVVDPQNAVMDSFFTASNGNIFLDWAVDTADLITSDASWCGQRARSLTGTSGHRCRTESCCWLAGRPF